MNLCVGIRRAIAMVGEAAESHSNFAVRLLLAQIIVIALLPMVPVHFSLQNGSAPPLDGRAERISGGSRYFRADRTIIRGALPFRESAITDRECEPMGPSCLMLAKSTLMLFSRISRSSNRRFERDSNAYVKRATVRRNALQPRRIRDWEFNVLSKRSRRSSQDTRYPAKILNTVFARCDLRTGTRRESVRL